MRIIVTAGWMVLGWIGLGFAAEPGSEPSLAEAKPVDYMIIVTGGELLAGAYADSHTPFLTRTLQLSGCRCVGSVIVDDDRQDLQSALRFATNRARLVIVTGGLGPTANDITRETLSEFSGIPLREEPEVVAEMERRFGQAREQLRANLRRQAQVPARGTYLKNPGGTAVGLVFDSGGPVIVALPGPPRELQPMARQELVPYLQRRFGVRTVGASLTLRFVGVGQSLITQTIQDHLKLPLEMRVTSLFEDGRVDFTFSLPGNSADDQARLKKLEADMQEHLGRHIYANDGSTLEEVVLKGVKARGASLLLAEIGSGGNVAARLSQVSGLAGLLGGAYSAPSEEAMERLLGGGPGGEGRSGADRPKAIAAMAAKADPTGWVIAVGPVESDATGAKHLWVALRFSEDRVEAERLEVRGSGETSQAVLVTQILDWFRRRVRIGN